MAHEDLVFLAKMAARMRVVDPLDDDDDDDDGKGLEWSGGQQGLDSDVIAAISVPITSDQQRVGVQGAEGDV
jgi:hypothetical protein